MHMLTYIVFISYGDLAPHVWDAAVVVEFFTQTSKPSGVSMSMSYAQLGVCYVCSIHMVI